MKLSAILIDAERREAGAWIGKIPHMPGVRFHVRGFHCRADKEVRERELAKFPPHHRLTDDEDREIINAVMREALLLGWSGIEGDDNQPWSFTSEHVELVLTDPRYEKLREGLGYAMGRVAQATTDELEADVKN